MEPKCAGFVAPLHAFARPQFSGQSVICSRPAACLSPGLGPRRTTVSMGAALNREKKSAKVEAVKESISKAQLVFSVPLPGLTNAQMMELRRSLPDGVTCQTVKNTLMRRAVKGTEWEVANDICKNSSIWFFVEDDYKGALEMYQKFAKLHQRDDIIGGVMEGVLYDNQGVADIAKLPSKQELYAKIAMLIKAVPTKVARTVKAVPTKVGRAIHLAVNDPSKDNSAESAE